MVNFYFTKSRYTNESEMFLKPNKERPHLARYKASFVEVRSGFEAQNGILGTGVGPTPKPLSFATRPRICRVVRRKRFVIKIFVRGRRVDKLANSSVRSGLAAAAVAAWKTSDVTLNTSDLSDSGGEGSPCSLLGITCLRQDWVFERFIQGAQSFFMSDDEERRERPAGDAHDWRWRWLTPDPRKASRRRSATPLPQITPFSKNGDLAHAVGNHDNSHGRNDIAGLWNLLEK